MSATSPLPIARLVGTGHYLPERTMSNDELAHTYKIETSNEWVVQRTGILQRHFAADNQRSSDLAMLSARPALEMADMEAAEIDLIILATTTPDHTFPATAVRVAHLLGAKCPAFDLQAVCAGFIFALAQADMAIRLGKAKRALVIGSEVYSRLLDWQDRGTCVLFGDGAGAVVLEASHDNAQGIIDTEICSDGQYYHDLFVDGGVHDARAGVVKMSGREVYKQAIIQMTDVVEVLMKRNRLSADDLNWLIPHQANQRIMEQVGERLKLQPSQTISTVDRHANISAATIPTALDIAVRDGRLQPHDLLALTALGGGFSWGGVLLRY